MIRRVKKRMTYKQIKNLGEKEFKRLRGVKPKLFEEMVAILKEKSTKGRPRGRQTKLDIEDQLLMALYGFQGLNYEEDS